jgi:hypothetical protein
MCTTLVAVALASCGGAKDGTGAESLDVTGNVFAQARSKSWIGVIDRSDAPVLEQKSRAIVVGAADWTPLASDPPAAVPAPGGQFDHSMTGPLVDTSKYATVDPANKYTANRVASVWNYPGPAPQYWYPCEQGSRPDCTAAAGNIANQNLNDIGAFREIMPFAGMSNDDPIVYPGQQGRAHSHTFFGNLVDYKTTSANIRNSSWCASAGGKLNCTAVWIPTVIDTADGSPVVPGSMNFYYKGSSFFAPSAGKDIATVPVGLHMISGDAKNVDPKGAINARYICYGPNGENPGWKPTLTAAVADGTCLPGGEMVMMVSFPNCWDGVNLDSPDHASHMAQPVQLQQAPFTWSCPTTHPVQIPTMSVNAHFPVRAAGQVARWRLASDMYDPSLPAGLSGHADYMMGWDPAPHPELWGENKSIVEMWTTHCLREQRDCHNYLLGDNKHMLY